MTLQQYHDSMIKLIEKGLTKGTISATEYATDDIRFIQTVEPGHTVGYLRQDKKTKKWKLGIRLPMKYADDKSEEEFEVLPAFVTLVQNYVKLEKEKEVKAKAQQTATYQKKMLDDLKERLHV